MSTCRIRSSGLHNKLSRGREYICRRWYDTHSKQLEMLSPQDLRLTFPEGSKHLNEQHFYQVSLKKWLERKPRPLTLAQMIQYGRHMSKQKVLQSANHVAEELTIRFAHRIRQMQNTPYRLMGHPALLDTYEQYVDSFEMLRRVGTIETLEDNVRLMQTGQALLQKHTLVVTNIIRGVREIIEGGSYKPEDVQILDGLVRSMLTSRLSRRVLVKQHAALTEVWESGRQVGEDGDHSIGEVKLDCRIVDALPIVEQRAKASLAQAFNTSPEDMPAIILEGDPKDTSAPFPYLWRHFEFAFGELMYNSLEACLRANVRDPIVVTVSATPDSMMIRMSDHGGGIKDEKLSKLWSFIKPGVKAPSSPRSLVNHQFFSLLFPAEDLVHLPSRMNVDGSATPQVPPGGYEDEHFGLGLALSRLYLEYWGGTLELHSLEGFGCDALLRVSRNGTIRENLGLTS